jgi:hypothetical protein
LPRLHAQLCVPVRRFLQLFIEHTAAVTYGNIVAVTFCYDIRHSEP